MGKYSRVDGRRSSNYCSTIAIVVFVGVCLVGVWMMMSSSIVPIQNSELVSDDTQNEVLNEVQKKIGDNDSRQFEDSSGNFPLDAAKRETDIDSSQGGSNTDAQDNQTLPDKGSEDNVEENPEATTQENSEDKTEPEEEPKKHKEQNSGDGEQNAGDGESNSKTGETKMEGGETDEAEQAVSEESTDESKSDSNEDEKKSEANENTVDTQLENKAESQSEETEEEKVEQNQEENVGQNQEDNSERAGEEHIEIQAKDQSSNEVFPAGSQSEILNESTTGNGDWSTQMVESKNEKESLQSTITKQNGYGWKLCNVTAGPDYIPCLDNVQTIRRLPSTKHYEHRERHCPDEAPTCLVSLPEGYKRPVPWPKSREKVYHLLLVLMKIDFFLLFTLVKLGSTGALCRSGSIMFPTQSLLWSKAIKIGLKLLVNTLLFLVAELSLRMVLFITLIISKK